MSRFRSIAGRFVGAKGLLLAAAIGTALVVSHSEGWAQSKENVRGTIRSFTSAPRGEIDGAVLDNGTVIHWPPHLAEDFKKIVAVGDEVQAVGQTETGPRGDTHFEVARLTNLKTNATAENDERAPPPPSKRGPRGKRAVETRAATTARGVVRSLITAPKGEVDGAVLDDGTVLHWPPHLEDQFKGLATVGDRVEAEGRTETAPRGEVHFEVQSLTNLRTNESSENEEIRPVPPRDRLAGREDRLRALEDQILQIQREITRLRNER